MHTLSLHDALPIYFEKANDESMLIVLLEDIEAWRNLDEILEVDGIDVFFVAPSDFAASMGHIGNPQHPDVQDKIMDTLQRIVLSGNNAGSLATTENVSKFVDIGVKFFSTTVQPWIESGYKNFLNNANK